MSGASDRLHKKGDSPSPRRKEARISPELDEVLRMLKALEEQIGQRLFDRIGRSVLLTDAGQQLLTQATHLYVDHAGDPVRTATTLRKAEPAAPPDAGSRSSRQPFTAL